MSTNTALDQIKARIEGLSNLCPEYMHLAIRNSVRNCDFDCQAHGEEEDCGPGQSDGARIAHSLADVPKLLAALEAVQAVCNTMRWQHGTWPDPEYRFARLLEEAIGEALR